MKVVLAYGRNGLEVELPADRTTVIEPEFEPGMPDELQAVRRALEAPIGSPPLAGLISGRGRVAIAVCDPTRPMPHRKVLPAVLEALGSVPDANLSILVATGTHRATTPAEFEEMLGAEIAHRYRIVSHDCEARSDLVRIGETTQGIPAWVNRHWAEAAVRITTGFVEPHFFAGYSGGPKLVAPGLAGLETVLALHSAPIIADPRATWGVTRGNPMHDAIREIAQLAGVEFSVDVTLNAAKQITGVFAGAWEEAHARACRQVERVAMRPVDQPFDVVVTTNSGYPLDLNLYQAIKGISAAARIVKPGGTIVCAAECREGIPEHGAYGRLLREAGSVSALLERIERPGFACRDQWQAQVQGLILRRARVLLKSELADAEVRGALLEPVSDVSAAVARELKGRGPDARVCVLPQGPQTIPYLQTSRRGGSSPEGRAE